MINIFSFFAGTGLLDLGFEDAGFNIVHVDEMNSAFLKCYRFARKNRFYTPCYGWSNDDIQLYLDDDYWHNKFPLKTNCDLIGFLGGPPCPDFSIAGRNAGVSGKNGKLTDVYMQLIIKRQPDFFVFENVKGLYNTKKHREYYDSMKEQLTAANFIVFDSLENALWYGVPQDRKRLFLIGFNRNKFGTDLTYNFGHNRVFNDEEINEIEWPTESPFREGSKLKCPPKIIKKLTIEYWFEKNRVLQHPNGKEYFKPHNLEKFYSIPEGHSQGKSFKRLHRWKFSPTAAYGNNEVHLHPYFARRLSVAEVMAIQSLPTEFRLPEDISLSSKFKMIANGVPYLLSLGIAQELKKWLEYHI